MLRRPRTSPGGEELNALDYRLVLTDRWRWIAGGLVAGLLLAGLVAFLVPARYSSEVGVMLASPTSSPDPLQRYQADVTARERTAYYVPLVAQPRVATDVAGRTGGAPVEEVRRQLAASAPADTPLVFVTATGTSAVGAQATAGAAGDALVALVGQVEATTPSPTGPPVIASVVQPATPALAVSVSVTVQLVIGAVVGLLAGLALALVRQSRDPGVRSADELRAATRLPVLAAVSSGRRGDQEVGPVPTQRVEGARRIRSALDVLVSDRPRAVVVAGLRGGERASTTLLDLAGVVARAGRSVIVVEADLRRPEFGKLFGGRSGSGLVKLLGARSVRDSLRRSVQRDPRGLFDVLVAGGTPDDPTELLGSDAMGALLETLGELYDTVLIAAPPVLSVVDAAAVGALADGVLLVVARGRSSIDDVRDAAESLHEARARVVGTVLTHALADGGPYSREALEESFESIVGRPDPEPDSAPMPETTAPREPSSDGVVVPVRRHGDASARNGAGRHGHQDGQTGVMASGPRPVPAASNGSTEQMRAAEPAGRSRGGQEPRTAAPMTFPAPSRPESSRPERSRSGNGSSHGGRHGAHEPVLRPGQGRPDRQDRPPPPPGQMAL